MIRLIIPAAIILLFKAFSFAQVAEFAPVGAKWTYSEEAFIPPPFGEFPHLVEVIGQEVFQGKFCSKLAGIGSATLPDTLYVHTQGDSVYFYSPDSDQFELLYNFGAQAGDSWTIGGLHTPHGVDSLFVQVDSVTEWIIGGKSLKVLHLAGPFLFFDWGYAIVAGIGNTYFLTPDFGLYEGGPKGIRCYTDSLAEFYFVSYPCDTTLITSPATETDAAARISVFPNPAGDHILVECGYDAHNLFFRLFDVYGRQVARAPVTGGTNRVEIAGLNAGLYYWEADANTKRPAQGRIVVLHR